MRKHDALKTLRCERNPELNYGTFKLWEYDNVFGRYLKYLLKFSLIDTCFKTVYVINLARVACMSGSGWTPVALFCRSLLACRTGMHDFRLDRTAREERNAEDTRQDVRQYYADFIYLRLVGDVKDEPAEMSGARRRCAMSRWKPPSSNEIRNRIVLK